MIKPTILTICAGAILSISGCTLTPQQRMGYIERAANRATARAERIRNIRIRACRGDQACINDANNEYTTAINLLNEIENSRIDGELTRAHEAEKDWDEWLQSLPEEIRKHYEEINNIIERAKELQVRSEGTLSTGLKRVLTTTESTSESSTTEPQQLTTDGAIINATSMISDPGGWTELFRLQITGSVLFDFDDGSTVNSTTSVFNLEGNYDGMLNPGESISISSGSVTLFDGEMTINISSIAGSSSLRIFENGNGFLRVSGFTEYNDEWNDTDHSDMISLEFPVTLEEQTLHISSNDQFVPAHQLLSRPRQLISDYNRDGVTNYFDITDFNTEYNSGDMYADMNDDGILNTADIDFFLSEYNDTTEWNQFRSDWKTAQ